MSRKSKSGAFLRGYGNALLLCPNCGSQIRRYEFRGRDILNTSPAEALAEDWRMIGTHLVTALSEAEDEFQSKQPAHKG
jgi:hypothetical protein